MKHEILFLIVHENTKTRKNVYTQHTKSVRLTVLFRVFFCKTLVRIPQKNFSCFENFLLSSRRRREPGYVFEYFCVHTAKAKRKNCCFPRPTPKPALQQPSSDIKPSRAFNSKFQQTSKLQRCRKVRRHDHMRGGCFLFK